MKTLVITGATTEMHGVLSESISSKEEWTTRHGYELKVVELPSDRSDLGFYRLELSSGYIGSYDSVMWLDADSIITNPDFKIEDFLVAGTVFTASWDWPHDAGEYFSTGNFIITNADNLQEWRDGYLEEKPNWLSHSYQEQNTLNSLYRNKPYLFNILPHGMLSGVPEVIHRCKQWNGRPWGMIKHPWKEGDFLAHLSAADNEGRIQIMKEFNARPYASPTPL